MRRPVLRRYPLMPPGWPPEMNLRIGVISDIHACEPWMPAERIHAIAAQVNALKPDIIVLLGDFNAGHRFITAPVQPGAWADALSGLAAPLGVFAVLGNHDWWHGPAPGMPGGAEEVRRALTSIRVRVLENQALRLRKDGRDFWLAGLADQMAHRRAHHEPHGADDLVGTLRQIDGNAPVIMLMHEPFRFADMPDRVCLTLCGHTHGGQVRLPVIGAPFAASHRYLNGLVVENGRHMVISAGLGESGLPVRLGVPPEILMIELGHPALTA